MTTVNVVETSPKGYPIARARWGKLSESARPHSLSAVKS
jgi:hypothetical protein